MVFSNIDNNEAGMPVVFSINQVPAGTVDLLINFATSCSENRKMKYCTYEQLAYLQNGDNNMYSIVLDGHDYSSMMIVNDMDDVPYHVRNVLIGSGRSTLAKGNNKVRVECNVGIHGDYNMCIGLYRIG